MKKYSIIILVTLLVAIAAVWGFKLINGGENMKEQFTFEATVLENAENSIMVEPVEGENELSSSDKIVVRLPKDGAGLEDLSRFTVGSRVRITYDGTIMESYPAQINALKVEFAE